jgi:hypothetical protein
MNAKLVAVIANRPFKRDERGLEKLGPYEAGLEKLVDDILGNIDAVLASGVSAKSSDEDAPGLQFDVSITLEKFRLEAYLAPLIRNLRLLDPRRTEISSMFLMQLLSACYRAGQLTPNEKILRGLRADLALRGTDGNKAKADAQNPKLDAAIVDEAKTQNRALARSIKFAAMIRPGVRVRLGLAPDEQGWPSKGTIKRAISERIKKSTPKE